MNLGDYKFEISQEAALKLIKAKEWTCPICKCFNWNDDSCKNGDFNKILGPMDGPKILGDYYLHNIGLCEYGRCYVCLDKKLKEENLKFLLL
jgi:hypothetical protein